jgi:hypothetical protein
MWAKFINNQEKYMTKIASGLLKKAGVVIFILSISSLAFLPSCSKKPEPPKKMPVIDRKSVV